MNLRTEILIVGAGLAGVCAARFVRNGRDVVVAERDKPAGGASSAAAGMVNPLLGRRAQPVWRMHEALDALSELLGQVGATDDDWKRGILRPAVNDRQAERFARAADRNPDIAHWLIRQDVERLYPHLEASHGALYVREGGALHIPEICARLLSTLDVRPHWTLEEVVEDRSHVRARFTTPEGEVEVTADFIVIAPGAGYRTLSLTQNLDLHCVKGQTVTVDVEANLAADHPHIAGLGYIVVDPQHSHDGENGTRLVLGSTYQHEFEDDLPSPGATEEILEKTRQLMPPLEDARLVDERAGIRVTVPVTRLPFVGPIPGRRRTWIFSGLGAKGLLMAPLIARRLPEWMESPESIPDELRPRIRE